MARAYFGYQMVDGKMVIHQEEADRLCTLFKTYLEGKSITNAGKIAGIDKPHGPLGRLLKNKVYVGNEIYPRVIEPETFNKVQEERQRRSNQLGRNFDLSEDKLIIPNAFKWRKEKIDAAEPFKMAEQFYQLIEVIE